MKPGIYEMTNAEYQAHEGVSRSQFSHALKSRGHWELYKNKYYARTDAKDMGTLVHAMLLEPEKVAATFLDKPKIDKRSKEGKNIWTAFEMRLIEENKQAKDPEMFASAENMCAIIRNDEITRKIMYGHKEMAFFWRDEESGMLCKCKPDVANLNALILTDIKTTRDASPYSFMRSVSDYGYEIQSAYYIDGVRQAIRQSTGADHEFKFLFLAIENIAPYMYSFYDLPEDFVESGRKKYKAALKLIKYWKENPWKQEERKYNNDIVTLRPKAYQYFQEAE